MGGCCLGAVANMGLFGLNLGLLTIPASLSWVSYKLAATVFCAALGSTTGGFVKGWFTGGRQALHGEIYGPSLGLFSFSYLLGPGRPAPLASLATAGLMWAGGWAAERWRSSGPARHPGMSR